MSSLPSDRALRRLVAEIAMAGPDDIRAILDDLEPAQRVRVERMLAGLAGESEVRRTPVQTSIDRPALPDGLSPALMHRLGRDATEHGHVIEGQASKSFAMTTLALTTLQSCAAVMASQQASRVADAQRPTLLVSLFGLIPGLRATT